MLRTKLLRCRRTDARKRWFQQRYQVVGSRRPDREGSIEPKETNAGPAAAPRHPPVRLARAASRRERGTREVATIARRCAATSCGNRSRCAVLGLGRVQDEQRAGRRLALFWIALARRQSPMDRSFRAVAADRHAAPPPVMGLGRVKTVRGNLPAARRFTEESLRDRGYRWPRSGPSRPPLVAEWRPQGRRDRVPGVVREVSGLRKLPAADRGVRPARRPRDRRRAPLAAGTAPSTGSRGHPRRRAPAGDTEGWQIRPSRPGRHEPGAR
jgi:hypothetical protein